MMSRTLTLDEGVGGGDTPKQKRPKSKGGEETVDGVVAEGKIPSPIPKKDKTTISST